MQGKRKHYSVGFADSSGSPPKAGPAKLDESKARSCCKKENTKEPGPSAGSSPVHVGGSRSGVH